jgi:biotin transport system substrate-specific component
MLNTRAAVRTWSRLEALASPRVRQIVGLVAFAVLTALSARIAVPLPGTLVPFTFQPLAVLLAGGLLGARLGAGSQLLYLGAGMAGLPVFATGFLLGPTAGYLLAFPVAAFVVGSLSGRGVLRGFLAATAGLAAIYAGGVAWLTIVTDLPTAIATGFVPFVLADLVKAGMAAVIVSRLRGRTRTLFGD